MANPQQPEIPQSQALREAQPDGLSELMSLDPEGFRAPTGEATPQLSRIIVVLREKRGKFKLADAAAGARPKRGAKEMMAKTSQNPEDLGL